MKKVVVEYLKEELELSREYSFGEVREVSVSAKETKKVTVVKCNELTGFDDEKVMKAEKDGKMAGYAQIAISIGISYEEALYLANKDRDKLMETIMGF